jgi:hypothetical protein
MGVSAYDHDMTRQECYPASPGLVPEPASSCGQVLVGHDVSAGMRLAQFQNLTQAQCCDRCDAEPGQRCTAWIHSAPGGGHTDDQGNNCWLMTGSPETLKPAPSQYRTVGGRVLPGTSPPPPSDRPPPQTTWAVAGSDADLYLAVTPNGSSFQRALYELTGAPALPPRYALGLHASWWGYRTYADVTTNMSAFRKGRYPVDNFIMVRYTPVALSSRPGAVPNTHCAQRACPAAASCCCCRTTIGFSAGRPSAMMTCATSLRIARSLIRTATISVRNKERGFASKCCFSQDRLETRRP